MHGLQPVDYWVVALFMLGMLGMGWHFSRRQEGTEDYFVAGRRMPWLAVGLSTLATLTSTITYLAVPGEMIKHGIGYFTGLIAVPFTLAFLSLVTIPFLMRLRLTSAYEYLELRFDRRTRLLGAGMFGCLSLGWMATVVYTASFGVAEMTGLRLHAVILVVGCVGIAYTAMGGIRADIWTDVVQAVIMFLGAIFAIGFVAVATRTGPVDWWRDAAQVQHTSVPLLDLNPMVRVSMVTVALNQFLWHICQASGSQVAMQRFFTMGSVRAGRSSVAVNAGANTLLSLLLALCGIALFSFYFRQPELLGEALNPRTGAGAERIFPHFIAHQLPPVMGGLLISALFAAAMSTLDSGVNSLAAVLTIDVLQRPPRGETSRTELRFARRLTLALGAAVTLAAAGIDGLKGANNTLLDILPPLFNWAVGPLGGVFLAGMFLPRATARSVVPAGLVGGAVGLATGLLKPVFAIPFSFAWVITYAFGITLLVAWLLSLREPRKPAGEPLTWRAVLSRPEPGEPT